MVCSFHQGKLVWREVQSGGWGRRQDEAAPSGLKLDVPPGIHSSFSGVGPLDRFGVCNLPAPWAQACPGGPPPRSELCSQ